jgi:hypothetical protein
MRIEGSMRAGCVLARDEKIRRAFPSRRRHVLEAHDQVPHFEVTTIGGQQVRYATVWQHRALVLVCLDDAPSSSSVAETEYLKGLDSLDRSGRTEIVVTRDAVRQVPRPGALVADQWGEIAFVRGAESVEQLPAASELSEWLQWVRMKCPECEGETK